MNKIFKVLWNKSRGCFVVSNEAQRIHGKEKSEKRLAISLGLASLLGLASFPSYADVATTEITNASKWTSTTITTTGNLTKIETTKIQGDTANNNGIGINHFDKFNLKSGNIANLIVPDKANNLVNFVNQSVNIDGTVNSLKGSKVGGNLFFVTPNGMTIGATGVINAGSLTAIVPTQDAYDEWTGDISGKVTSALLNKMQSGAVALNRSGVITVNGNIDVVNRIVLAASKVEIGSGAKLTNKRALDGLKAVVNIPASSGITEVSAGVDGTFEAKDTADGTGDILLYARTDTNDASSIEAKVNIAGTIASRGDVGVVALAGNGTYNERTSKFESGISDSVRDAGTVKATVEVTGLISSDKDVGILARADNQVLNGGALQKLVGNLTAKVLGSISGINEAVAYGNLKTVSTVTVAEGASINAAGNLSIQALADTRLEIGAAFAAVQTLELLKTGAEKIPAAAVVVSMIDTQSSVVINGSLTTGGNLTIASEDTLNGTASAVAAEALGKDKNPGHIAFTYAKFEGASSVNIGSTASITLNPKTGSASGGDVSITSKHTSRVNTTADASVEREAYGAIAINYTEHNTTSSVTLNTGFTGVANKLTIESNNTTERESVYAQTRTGAVDGFKVKVDNIVKGLSQNFASGLLGNAAKAVNKNFEAKKFRLVGTAGVITGTQSSTVTINAPEKTLKAAGDISISSLSKKFDHHYTVFAQSDGDKSKDENQTGEVTVAGAIGLLVVLPDGSDTVTSDLTIADKVTIESTAGTVVINNKAEISYNRIQAMIGDLLEKVELLKKIYTRHNQGSDAGWDKVETAKTTLENASKAEGANPSTLLKYTNDVSTNIKTAFKNLATATVTGISTVFEVIESACQFIQVDSYVNSYVSAAASADKDKTAFGGGLGVIQQSTASNLTIGKGVKIYAKPTATTDTVAIDVAADSINETVALSGHLKSFMGVAYPTITDASSLGTTILVQSQKTNNTLTIREGAELVDNSELGIVRVTASDRIENITIGASADVSGGSFGISANVTTSLSEGTNLLRIDDEATLSGGSIKVEAKRRDNNQAIAGTASVGSGDKPSNNVGASVAINIIDFKNNVAIEDNDILDKEKDKSLYTKTGLMSAKRSTTTKSGTGVDISAHQDTTLNAIGASGGVSSSGTSEGGAFSEIKNWFSNIGDAVKGKFSGIGNIIDSIEGNAPNWGNKGGNAVRNVFRAVFRCNDEGNGNLNNPEDQQDVAGNENNNPGNNLFDEEGNANLDRGHEDGDLDQDIEKHFQMGLAASIAWNVIDLENKVTIKTDNFKIQTEKLNVEAATDKWIGAWAGGVAASLVDLNDAQTSTTAGVGGAVAVNFGTLTNKVDISRAGTVTGAKASLLLEGTTDATIRAVNNGKIIAEGLSAGIAQSKSAEGGTQNSFDISASINILENTVRADVSSVEQTTGDYGIAWNQAAWNGETQVTGGTGFGLSLQNGNDASRSLGLLFAYGNIKNTVASTSSSLTLRSAKNFYIKALTNVSQVTTSVGANVATGDSSFAFTGAAAATDFVNKVNAEVSNSSITLTSDGVTQILASGITDADSSEFKTLSNWVEESGIAKKANLDKELSNQDFYSEVTLQKKKDEAKADGQKLSELGTKTGLLQTSVVVSVPVSANASTFGAAILVNKIDNEFTTNVTSSQFNQLSGVSTGSYTQRAEANATSVGVAMGVAAAPDSTDGNYHYAVAGSVIVSNVDQTSKSTVTGSTTELKTKTVAIEAANKATTVNVAGEVGLSLGDKGSSGGAAVTVMNTDNRAEVSIADNPLINASTLTVKALNNARAWDVAVDVAVSKAVSFAGSVAVNRVKNESVITVNGLTLKDLTASSFLSDDTSNLWTLAGGVAYTKGSVGAAGAVAYSISGRGSSDGTKVDVSNLTVQKTSGNSSGDLTVKAEATDKVHTLVIAAGVGTEAKVGFAGAAGVGEVKRETTASVKNLKTQMLNTDGSVIASNTSAVLGALSIKAIETSGIYNLGLAGAYGEKLGLGLGIAVNRITTTTNASLTDDTTNKSRIKAESLEVAAKTADDIENIAIGGAGAEKIALMGSVAFNKLTDNTKAELSGVKVDLTGGAASVNAQSDDVIGSYVGQIAGSKTGAGGLSVLVNLRYGTTEANVTDSEVKQTATPTKTLKAKGTVDAEKINNKIVNDISVAASLENDRSETTIEGIRVGATSTTTLKSFVINGAGAGEGAGTGGATVNYHGGATKTTVTNSKLEAVKDLILESGDYVNIDNVLTIGAFAGKGAGTIAANVATTEHETTTTVSGGSLTSSAGAVKATSDAKEGVSSLAIGLAGAQYGAGAVLVNVTRELSDVKTELSKTATTTVAGKTVEAKSDYLGRLNSLAIMGDGAQYGAGVINVIVNYNDNTVATNLGASKIKATDSVTVTSLRRTENFGVDVQVAGAMYGALAATIIVNTVEGSSNVTTDGAIIEGTETTANGNTTKATPAITLSSAGEDVFHLVDVSVTGALYGSVGTLVVVNRFLGTALTNVETSTIDGGTVTIEAKQNRDIFANNTFICGSIGTLGANVLATVIGGSADPFATATIKFKDLMDKLTGLEKTVQDYSNSYAGSSTDITEEKAGILATVIKGVGKNLTETEKREMIKVAAKSAATAPTTTEGTQVRVNGSTVRGSTVTIEAKEDTESWARTTLKTGEYSVAGVAVAASVGTLRENRNLKTTISASNVTATNKVTIGTEIAGQSTLHSYQGKVDGAAAGTAYTDVDIKGGSSVLIDTAKISVGEAGEIAITAEDKSKTEAYSLGIEISLLSGDCIIAETADKSSVGIEIKNSSTSKVSEISGKTTVLANRATERKSEVKAGTGGAFNLTWSDALVTDSGNTSVTITGIKTSGSLFDARALNEANLYTKSYQGYCSVLNVGVLQSTTTATGKTTLTATSNTFASDAVTLDALTGVLTFDSDGNKKTDDALRLTSIVKSYGSSVIFGDVVNCALIENTTETNLTVTGNTYKTTAENQEKYTKLNLSSYGYAVYEIISDLGTGGVLGEGAADAELRHNAKVTANVSATDAKLDSFSLDVDNIDKATLKAYSAGGSVVEATAEAAYVKHTDTSSVATSVSGTWNVTGNVEISSLTEYDLDFLADNTKGCVLGGSSAKLDNSLSGSNTLTIAGTWTALGDFYASSLTSLDFGAADSKTYAVDTAVYGGISGANGTINNTVNRDTIVNVAKNASITATDDLDISSQTKEKSSLRAHARTAGLSGGVTAYNDNTIVENTRVNLEEGTNLRNLNADKEVTISASNAATRTIEAIGDVYAVIAGAGAISENSITQTNEIQTAQTSKITGAGKVNLYAGRDISGEEEDFNFTVYTHAYAKSIGGTQSKLEDTFALTNRLTLNGDVLAVRSIDAVADIGSWSVSETSRYWELLSDRDAGNIRIASSAAGTKLSSFKPVNSIVLNGKLTAGTQTKSVMTITGLVDSPQSNYIIEDTTVAKPNVESEEGSVLGTVTSGTESISNNYVQRYNELVLLLSDFKENDTSQTAVIAYRRELELLKAKMEEQNLATFTTKEINGKNISIATVVEKENRGYVSVSDIAVAGGDVNLTADSLTGTGSITANAAEKISIDNQTNLALKVENVRILEKGGNLTLNGVALSSNPAGFTGKLTSETNSSDPSMTITSKYLGTGGRVTVSSKDASGGTITKTITPDNTITVNGVVANDAGDLTIAATGDLFVMGTRLSAAGSMSLSATRSVMQTYTSGMRNIAGDVKDLWSNEVAEFLKNVKTSPTYGTGDSIKTPTGKGIIAGSDIFISADNINLNGTVQSGYATWTVDLTDTELEGKVTQLKTKWKNEGSKADVNPISNDYLISAGGHYKTADGTYAMAVSVWYDPVNDRIIVDDINPEGGHIYLTGRVASTGGGKLYAASASADVNINSGTHSVRLGEITTSNGNGIIEITDTTSPSADTDTDAVARIYKWVDDGVSTTLTQKILYRDGTIEEATDLTETTIASATEDSFSPTPNLAYVWSDGYRTGTFSTASQDQKFKWWGAWNSGDPSTWSTYHQNLTPEAELTKGITLATNWYTVNDKKFNASAVSTTKEEGKWKTTTWTTYDNWTHWSGTYHAYAEKRDTGTTIYTYSVKADEEVGVNFLNGANRVTVNSGADIVLSGKVTAVDGEVNLTAGRNIINESSNAAILNASTVNLTATRGAIGESESPIRITNIAGTLNLSAKASLDAPIYIDATKSSADVSVNASLLEAADVNLSTQGSVEIADLKAYEANIVSKGGNIVVSNLDQIASTSEDNITRRFDATAAGSVDLAATDDIGIGKIKAGTSVTVTSTNGNVWDALMREDLDNRNAEEKIALWKEAGILSSEGTNNGQERWAADVEEQEKIVKNDFKRYLQYEALDSTKQKNLTESQTKDYNALKTRFAGITTEDDALNAERANSESNLAKAISIKDNYGWSPDELLYAVSKAIVNPDSSTVLEAGDINIEAKTITINASKSAGIELETQTIKFSDINSEAYKVLARADVDDVKWGKGSVEVTLKRPISIKLTGNDETSYVEGEAGTGFYVASDEKLRVNYIKAPEATVRLTSAKGIDALYDSITTALNIYAKNITLRAGEGSVGASDKPIYINSSNAVALSGKTGIYIVEQGEELKLVSASTEGDLDLTADKITQVTLEGQGAEGYLTAKRILLKGGDDTGGSDIGTKDESLKVKVLDNGSTSVVVNSSSFGIFNLEILGEANYSLTLNENTLEASKLLALKGEGNLTIADSTKLSTAGTLRLEAGKTLTIKDSVTLQADDIDLTATGGDVVANKATFKPAADSDNTNVSIVASQNVSLKDAKFEDETVTLNVVATEGSVNLTRSTLKVPLQVKELSVDAGGDIDVTGMEITSSTTLKLDAEGDISAQASKLQSGTSLTLEAENLQASGATLKSENGSVTINTSKNASLSIASISAANGKVGITSTEGYVNLSSSSVKSSVKGKYIDVNAKMYLYANGTELDSTETLVLSSEGNVLLSKATLKSSSTATTTPSLKVTSSNGTIGGESATITSNGATEIIAKTTLNLKNAAIASENGTLTITSTSSSVNLATDNVAKEIKAKELLVKAAQNVDLTGRVASATETMTVNATWEITGTSSNLTSENALVLSGALGIDAGSAKLKSKTAALSLTSSVGMITATGATFDAVNGNVTLTAKTNANLKDATFVTPNGALQVKTSTGNVNLSTTSVGNPISVNTFEVDSGGDATFGTRSVTTSNTLTVKAKSDIESSGTFSSGSEVNLEAQGSVRLNQATVKSKYGLSLQSQYGSLEGEGSTLQSTSGSIAVKAKRNIALQNTSITAENGGLEIASSSGDINLSALSGKTSLISATSVDIEAKGNVEALGTRIESSGVLTIDGENLDASGSTIQSTNDYLEINAFKNLTLQNASITATNGEARINSSSENINLSATAGQMTHINAKSVDINAGGSVEALSTKIESENLLSVTSDSLAAGGSTIQSTNGSVVIETFGNAAIQNASITATNGTVNLASSEGYINLSASSGSSSSVKAQTIAIDAKKHIRVLGTELESTGSLTVNSEGDVYALNAVLTSYSTDTVTPALKLTSSSGSINAGEATITSYGATEITSNFVLNLLNAAIASESGTLVITSTSSMVNLAADDAAKEIKAKTLLVNAGQHVDLTGRVATANDSMTLTAAGLISGTSSNLRSNNALTLNGAIGIDVGSATLKSETAALTLTSTRGSISAIGAALESPSETKLTASSDVNLANATLTSTEASISVSSTDGAFTATGATFNATNGNVTLVSESDMNLTDVTFVTPNGALLVKTDTGNVNLSTTSVGNSISVNTFEVDSGGDATFGTRSVTTSNALAIKAKNDIESSGTFSSGTTVNLEAQGSVRLNQASFTSQDALTVLSQYGSIEAEGSTLQSTNDSVTVTSKKNMNLKNAAITAEAGSINVTSTAGGVNLAATDNSCAIKALNVAVAAASEVNLSSRRLEAAGDLKVTSQDTIVGTSASLASEDLVALQAKQGMTLDSANLTAHNTLTLTSEAGYITAPNATLTAAGAFDVEAKGNVNFTDSTLNASNGTIEIHSTKGDVTLRASTSSIEAIRAKNLVVKAAEEIDVRGRKVYLGDVASRRRLLRATLPSGVTGVLLFESDDSILADSTDINASSIALTSNYGDLLARNAAMVSTAGDFTLVAGETIDVSNSTLNAVVKKLSFTSDFGSIKAESATLKAAREIALTANGDVSLSGTTALTAPTVAITSEFALVNLSGNARVDAESIKLVAETEDISLSNNVLLNATTDATLYAGDEILQVDNSVITAPTLYAEAEDSIYLESDLGNKVPTVALTSVYGDISYMSALDTVFSINDALDGFVFGDISLYAKESGVKLTDTLSAYGDISVHAKSFEAPALFAEDGVYVSTNFNNDEKGTSIKITEGVVASEIGLMAEKGSIEAGVLNAMDGSICLYRTSLTTEGTIKVEEFYASDNSFIYNANGNISPGLACEEEVHIAFGGKGVLDKASISPEASIYVMHAMGRLTDTINSMTKDMENDWKWFPMLGWNETAYSIVECATAETAKVYRRQTKDRVKPVLSEDDLIHDYWTRGYPQQKIEGLLSFD